MANLPNRADIAGAPSKATAQAAFTSLYDFVASRFARGTAGVSPATGAELSSARSSLGLGDGQLAGNRNKLLNGAFAVNQRNLSGTVVLTAGQYGHDGWKAGASGCTYTFATVNNVTTITIAAGSLLQIISGKTLFDGIHVLSWAGTAQGRVGATSYGGTGTIASVTGGAATTVEFSTGTLALVQFEPGITPTFFEFRLNELQLCQARYQNLDSAFVLSPTAAGGYVNRMLLPVQMDGTPAVTLTIAAGSGATVLATRNFIYQNALHSQDSIATTLRLSTEP